MNKIWSTKYADKKFREAIYARDKKCLRCGKTGRLECSHFFDRSNSATRYDFENCIALCCSCHAGNAQGWEYKKQTDYRDFMIKRLGQNRYDELCKRADSIVPRREAIKNFIEILEDGKNMVKTRLIELKTKKSEKV